MKRTFTLTSIILIWLLAFSASAMAAAPTAPSDLACTSHETGKSSTNDTITITWTPATDADDDLSGYGTVWDKVADTKPVSKTLGPDAILSKSSPLEDGSWYFHIRAIDNQYNKSETVHLGPFVISTQPSIASVTPGTGSGDTAVSVTIIGTSFMPGATVRIGKTEMKKMTNVEYVSSMKLTATIPSELLTASVYDVEVTNPNAKSDIKPNCFTVKSSSVNIDAGEYDTILANETLVLDQATAPADKTYLWTVESQPEDAVFELTDPESLSEASFTPETPGDYTLTLTVSEDGESVGNDTAIITVSAYPPGDINGDSAVDIADAIIVLQVLTGTYSGTIELSAIVTGDKIGMDELVYILQAASS